MGETTSLIQIKGIRDGLLVTLAGADWPDLVAAFIENIESRASFFQGGRVVLDLRTVDPAADQELGRAIAAAMGAVGSAG